MRAHIRSIAIDDGKSTAGPKYHYYNQYMMERIEALYPEGLPEPVVSKASSFSWVRSPPTPLKEHSNRRDLPLAAGHALIRTD